MLKQQPAVYACKQQQGQQQQPAVSACKQQQGSSSSGSSMPGSVSQVSSSSKYAGSGCKIGGSPRAAAGLKVPSSALEAAMEAGSQAMQYNCTADSEASSCCAAVAAAAIGRLAGSAASGNTVDGRVASLTPVQCMPADSAIELHRPAAAAAAIAAAAAAAAAAANSTAGSSFGKKTMPAAALQRQQQQQHAASAASCSAVRGVTAAYSTATAGQQAAQQCSSSSGAAKVPSKVGSSSGTGSGSSSSKRGGGWLCGIASRHPLAWHVAAVQLEVRAPLGVCQAQAEPALYGLAGRKFTHCIRTAKAHPTLASNCTRFSMLLTFAIQNHVAYAAAASAAAVAAAAVAAAAAAVAAAAESSNVAQLHSHCHIAVRS
jgi:hypothetical protein